MTPPRPEVVHEEPEQVALVHVRMVQAVLVPFPLVLLDHLGEEQSEDGDLHGGPLGKVGGRGTRDSVPTSFKPVSWVGISAVGAQILTS